MHHRDKYQEIISALLDGELAEQEAAELHAHIAVCPECRRRSKTTPKEMQILGIDEPISIYRPQGCQFCNHTGYKGRIAVHEIMYMNENMRNAVSHEKNLEVLRDLARQNGMVTLWSSCRNLVVNGVTSIQELMTLNVE